MSPNSVLGSHPWCSRPKDDDDWNDPKRVWLREALLDDMREKRAKRKAKRRKSSK